MNEYALHFSVFNNDFQKLRLLLTQSKVRLSKKKISLTCHLCFLVFFIKENIDQKDNRGKTPLELAILLKHKECVNILCQFGADCNIITKQGWNCEFNFTKKKKFIIFINFALKSITRGS